MNATQKQKKTRNLMAGTWTKAAIVRRKFKAGRPIQKDRELTSIAAIHEACILLDGLRNAMREAGLSPDDVRAALALATPETPGGEDHVYALPLPAPGKLPVLFTKVEKIEQSGPILPLGIVVWQRDREAEADDSGVRGVVWVQPFLTGPRASRALIEVRRIYAGGEGGEGRFN